MNVTCIRTGREGFTRWDGLVLVLFVVFLVAGLLLPAVMQSRNRGGRAPRISCVSNLKQAGLAMRMWSNDHGERFPQAVSTNEGGSMEFVESGDLVSHYLVVSNELVSPKILACPADKSRSKVSGWESLSNSGLSYFVGLDADERRPQSILSGDRDVVGGGKGLTRGWTNENSIDARWGGALHPGGGNIGLGDGSVQQVTDPELQNQIKASIRSRPAQVRFRLPGWGR